MDKINAQYLVLNHHSLKDNRVTQLLSSQERSRKLSNFPSDPTFASIDVGSHTIRLLIARLEGNHEIAPLRLERAITRLARNFRDGETLEAASMDESIAVLKEYAKLINGNGARSVSCGATGVVRRAANSGDFLAAVRESTGIQASVLSESEEALLSAKGVLSALSNPQGLILSFDLGGSSTEFLLMEAGKAEPLWSTSVFIGAATVTERYLRGDPVEASSMDRAMAAIREALAFVPATVRNCLDTTGISIPPFRLVGTAGTVTTLAAMFLEMTDYQPYRVNGLLLSEDWLTGAINLLARLPIASRREIPGLEKGREDIILGGALIVREVLRGLGRNELTVTDAGLLEGLLIHLIEDEYGWPHVLGTPLTWRLQKG